MFCEIHARILASKYSEKAAAKCNSHFSACLGSICPCENQSWEPCIDDQSIYFSSSYSRFPEPAANEPVPTSTYIRTLVRWKFGSALYSDAHSGKIREVVINALVSHCQGETTGSWMMLDGLLLSESICSSAVNALQSNDPSLKTAGSRAFGHSWNRWPRQKPQTKGSCDTGRFPVANTSNSIGAVSKARCIGEH